MTMSVKVFHQRIFFRNLRWFEDFYNQFFRSLSMYSKQIVKNNIFNKTLQASILNVLYEFQVQIKDVISFPLSFWLLSIICLAYYVAIFPFVSLGVPFFQKKFQFTQKNANFIASVPYLISAPGRYSNKTKVFFFPKYFSAFLNLYIFFWNGWKHN